MTWQTTSSGCGWIRVSDMAAFDLVWIIVVLMVVILIVKVIDSFFGNDKND